MRVALIVVAGVFVGGWLLVTWRRARPLAYHRSPRLEDYAGGMATPGWPERSR